MDLRNWLEQESPDWYRAVINVRTGVGPVLERPIHRYYTYHSVYHSERVIERLGGLTEGLMYSSAPLSPTEVYILLAAAYVHDIGMQDEQAQNGDLNGIRDRHHELTERIVLQSIEQSREAIPLTPVLPPAVVHAVALVAKGHRGVDLHQDKGYDDFTLGGETVRPRLLAALLRFADELDIDYRRVYMPNLDLMAAPPKSRLHWYKCHYVSGVDIKGGYVTVSYQFPIGEGHNHYKNLVMPLIQPKIESALAELHRIFQEYGVQIIVAEPRVRHIPGLESMPPEVERLAYEESTSWYDKAMRRLREEKSNIPPPPSPPDPVDSEIINA